MTTFAELFREGHELNALNNGMFAKINAREALSGSGIILVSDEKNISIQNGSLIGVAFYSLPDMELLDQLVSTFREKNLSHKEPEPILVFDVLRCKTMRDFELLIPGIGSVYHTPVVGIWKEGQLVEKSAGAEGRMLLSRLYNLKEQLP